MDELIEKSHFKSYSRLYPIIKKRFPNVSKAEVIEAIEKKFHGRHMKHTQKRPYMNRIFDPVIGCYFHDLFVNSKNQLNGGYHRYFHVFIESNSRYVFAYPVDDKDANTAIDTLDKFINDNQGKPIVKLTSDGEKGFNSRAFLDYCKERGIFVRINNDKAHPSLGLIDRFIRTLRDLHQPIRKGENPQLSDEMYLFSDQDMAQLIDEYNNTFHKTIGCSPKEMYDNPELEREWIRKRQRFKAVQKNIEDFVLPIGCYVRYRISDDDFINGKRRSQFSIERYKVIKRIGNRYVLQSTTSSSNGDIITKSRFELIRADDKYPIGKTFNYSQTAKQDEIVNTNFNGKYGVKFTDAGWV